MIKSIDIRGEIKDPDIIIFADSGDDDEGIVISLADDACLWIHNELLLEDSEFAVKIKTLEDAKNLIKAINRAIDLKWFVPKD